MSRWGFLFLILVSILRAEDNPVILVHGYGPRPLVNMRAFRANLEFSGVKSENIFLLDYPQLESPSEIVRSVGESVSPWLSKFPAGTRFDVIGHSYGGFIGLYSALELGIEVRKFISLASVARGMNELRLCRAFRACGKTIPQLVPFMSPFLQDFYTRFDSKIQRIEKCALYSPDDNVVSDPPDSGALPGGLTVEVKNASHMSFIHDRDLFQMVQTYCYGKPAPLDGFKHDIEVHQRP